MYSPSGVTAQMPLSEASVPLAQDKPPERLKPVAVKSLPETLKTHQELTIPMNENDTAHLAGAFDAAGSVRVQISQEDSYALDYRYSPVVRLYKPLDNHALLGKMDAYCDDNRVKYSVSLPEEGESDEFVWRVTDPESIRNFLEPMMPWLVVNHRPATIMLNNILPGIEREKHRTREGFLTMMSFADEVRAANNHGPDAKYTREYFEDLWEDAIEASA